MNTLYPLLTIILLSLSYMGKAQHFTLFDPPQRKQVGYAFGMHKTDNQQWAIALVKNTANPSISGAVKIQVYNDSLNVLNSVISVDTGLKTNPVRWLRWQDKDYLICMNELGGSIFNLVASPTITMYEIDFHTNSISNTHQITFSDSLHFFGIHEANNKLYFIGGINFNPSNTFPRKGISLEVLEINNNFTSIQRALISERLGNPTTGAILSINSFGESGFAVGCSGCFSNTLSNGNLFYSGYTDMALFNNQWQEISSNIIFPSPQPTWPNATLSRFSGPFGSGGILKLAANEYVFYGACRDSTHANVGGIYNQQEVFIAKVNNQLQVSRRTHFGTYNVADNIVRSLGQELQQICMGGDKNIYTIHLTNLGSSFLNLDSIEKLVISCFDTNLNLIWHREFHDSLDIGYSVLYPHEDGVYILSNNTARGGEKFHVLRIDGTAWATQVEKQAAITQWQIYPNPAQTFISFQAEQAVRELQLYDLQGKLLQTYVQPEAHSNLSLPQLSRGMYLLLGHSEQGIPLAPKKLMVR